MIFEKPEVYGIKNDLSQEPYLSIDLPVNNQMSTVMLNGFLDNLKTLVKELTDKDIQAAADVAQFASKITLEWDAVNEEGEENEPER